MGNEVALNSPAMNTANNSRHNALLGKPVAAEITRAVYTGVEDLAATIKKAFFIATSGRPGPVVLGLWSTIDFFRLNKAGHPHVYLYDCASGRVGCSGSRPGNPRLAMPRSQRESLRLPNPLTNMI